MPIRDDVVTEEALAKGVKAVANVTREVENPKVEAVCERIVCGFRIAFDMIAATALILLVVIWVAVIVAFGTIIEPSVGFVEPPVIKRLSIVAVLVLIVFEPRRSEDVFIVLAERATTLVFGI